MDELRTQEEIIQRIKANEKNLFFTMTAGDLMKYLPFDIVKEYLEEGLTPSDWKMFILTKASVIAEMVEYLPFAFMKAEDQRGLSASRSIQHILNWLWLIKDYEMFEFANDDDNYFEYGRPILNKVKAKYDPEGIYKYGSKIN